MGLVQFSFWISLIIFFFIGDGKEFFFVCV